MDRRFAVGIPAVLIAIVLISVVVINADSLMGGDDESIEIIDFDYQKAGNHVAELVKWGPRMTGSEAELKGAEYIASQFQDAGLSDVHIEEFQVPMFEIRKAEVSLVEYYPMKNLPRPMGRMIEFEHMTDFVLQGYSGSLNWNNFRDDLDVVNIGNGTDPDSYSMARGRVCLVEQNADTPANKDLYFYAYQAGARAIILQNVWRGESIGYLPMFKTNQNPVEYDDYPDIPFFMGSKDAGNEILEATSSNYRLRLDFDVRIGDLPCRVVVGDIKGSSDGMVMFTAHHDTCYNTLGAIDNTVGPASLIEVARGMAAHGGFKKTVRFCTFGGEEEGLYGSIAYQQAHSAELTGKLEMVMNFDMAHTDKEAMRVSMVTDCNKTLSKLEDITKKLLSEEPSLEAYEIGLSYGVFDIPYSDYWPFTNAGASGIAAWGSGCEEYHTYLDNLDHLNPESLQIEGRILGSYALMAAT
jgi:Iap family predicted aminopeptidase